MKLKLFTLTLILLTAFPISNSKNSSVSQKPKRESRIERIEREFKELDQAEDENATISVDFLGGKENPNSVTIKVERQGFYPSRHNYLLGDFSISSDLLKRLIRNVLTKKESTGELPGAVVMQIGATDEYVLQQDYTYRANTFSITAQKGFKYDRASVPDFVWFITKDSLSNVAPLFHDLLYRNGGVLPTEQVSPRRNFTRKEADDLFLELMNKCGVKKWRQQLAYQAVRRLSGFAWKGKER